jgi:uncharacterized protein (TIGR02147 family)
MVLNGQRHPGKKLREKLAISLGFSDEEKAHFETLVALKKRGYNQILRLKQTNHVQEEDSIGISRWKEMVIRELSQLPGFCSDSQWISEKLKHSVSFKSVSDALQALVTDGYLVERNGRSELGGEPGGKWTRQEVAQFHREGFEASIRAMEFSPLDARVFQTSFLRVKKIKMEIILQKIRAFQVELSRYAEDQEGEEIYQLNLQFFPVAYDSAGPP